MKRIAFVVTGRVQGVGFRKFTLRAAEACGVAGHVRNAVDGSVVGEAEGHDAAIEEFLAAIRRGPTFSRVESVEVQDLLLAGEAGFVIR
jgi:acylphosphatase